MPFTKGKCERVCQLAKSHLKWDWSALKKVASYVMTCTFSQIGLPFLKWVPFILWFLFVMMSFSFLIIVFGSEKSRICISLIDILQFADEIAVLPAKLQVSLKMKIVHNYSP